MGEPIVVAGAPLMCSFGLAPSTLVPTPGVTMVEGRPVATITDIAPGANIPPFGMCQSIANPAVAAATAAALGVLTPVPCMPVTVAPWAPGAATTMVSNRPALTASSKCMCAWGGVISILFPGSVSSTAG